jgi:Ca2+-binding RTX toxin-like protein
LDGKDMLLQSDRVTKPGRIDGGKGDDLMAGGRGRNDFVGGPGTDGVTYHTRKENLTITLDGLANDGARGEADSVRNDVEVILGGNGHDRLAGNSGKNALLGGPGRDTLTGGGGTDALVGGDGDDLLYGDAGADLLSGGDGYDTLVGGAGSDLLRGDDGNDVLRSRDNERDALDGGAGVNNYERDPIDELARAPKSGVKK